MISSSPQVLNRSVDFTLGMFSKTTTRARAVDFSLSYAQSPLIMVVPPGQELSTLTKILGPFDESVWYVVGAMMLVIIVVTLTLKYQPRKIQDFVFGEQNKTPFLNIINVIVGQPIFKPPGRNFSRWMLTMFVILWLVIRSLYQAVLYQDLQSTERNLPVQSIRESLELGFMYYMLASTQDNIKYLPDVYNRRVVVSRVESFEVLKRFTDSSTKAAFLGGRNTVLYSNKVKLYGSVALYICKEPLMLRHYGIVFPKGSHLVESFDEKLLGLSENGLIDYWMSEHIETASHPLRQCEPLKLTLNHLLIAYQLFGVGLSLASTAFLLELLDKRLRKLHINKTSTTLGALFH